MLQLSEYVSDEQIYFNTTMYLNGGLSPSKKVAFICFNESSLKMIKNAFYFMLKQGCLGYPALGPHIRPPALQKFSTNSTSSYLKSSHYDHGLWVYGLFKPCCRDNTLPLLSL